ncbi:MAG TPA: hypothetical protein VNJ08_01400 [Bacteriovoracaceae bacterium]|nr:hypothetical protein [Bacteriovoracaceae bacterium]
MKTLFFLTIMSVSPTILAQGFIKDVEAINIKLGEKALDDHVKSGGKTPLAGEHIAAIMPTVAVSPDQSCIDEKDPKGTHYEVIFVGHATSAASTSNKVSTEPTKEHKNYAQTLVSFASKSSLEEHALAAQMANMIKAKFKTDEEKFNALAALSYRLMENYNDARNPGFNDEKNNPYKKSLPKGDLTLNQITYAAYNWKEFEGGVCNDISEAVALIGEKLFPDKDVLVVNAGSHHGVVVSDGKTNRIINYAAHTSMQNQLVLDDSYAATNMRISKMDEGHLKQIAVVDTQTGQMMEGAFQTGKPLLKTNADISTFYTHFKVVKAGDKNKHEFTATAGAGDLANSKMYVVVAKYEYTTDRWRNYAGVGGSALSPDGARPTKYQLHLRMGSEFGIIRYASPKLSVNFTSGLQAEGMYGFGASPSKGAAVDAYVDVSANVDLVNRLDATYRATPKTKLHMDLELRHTVGPSSWGNSTGSWAEGTGSGIGGSLANMGFHLNQINATAGVEHKITPKVTGFTEVKYQGSAVGQSLGLMGGVKIDAPKGAQIMIFSGYTTTKLPGYVTQHSLLVGSNGAIIGAGLQTKSGMTFTGSVSNIGDYTPPVVSAGLSVPIGAPPKKYVRDKTYD